MIDQVMSRPLTNANFFSVVDFLELAALIGPSGRVRIDTLIQDRKLQAEEAEENIGDADREIDKFFESVENEYSRRDKVLKTSYPFELSVDGEELSLRNCCGDCLSGSYLTCLIASHVGDGSDLKLVIPSGEGLSSEIIGRMRSRVFQMIGTIALAGRANGSAASVGWPRVRRNGQGETIVETMSRAVERGFPIKVRDQPSGITPAGVKDGGVDVVAWEHVDLPPSPFVWFGQIATGQNWDRKSVIDDARIFSEYFLDVTHRNTNHATIIPFNLDFHDPHVKLLCHKHGHILDRMRLMQKFKKGLDLMERGVKIDESENTHIALEWVDEFVQKLRNKCGVA